MDEELVAYFDKRFQEMLIELREEIHTVTFSGLERRIWSLERWKERTFRDPIEVIRERFSLRKSSD